VWLVPDLRYFEDFRAGQVFDTPDRPVSGEEVVAFAQAFDPQYFHTDPASAAGSVFGGHVASGWHTAALTMRLWVDHGPPVAGGIIGLGADELRWGPLHPGDRIRVVGEVLDTRASRSGAPRGVVRIRLRTLNQDGAEVQHMIASILVPTRST
jgi:acyl dehydratase